MTNTAQEGDMDHRNFNKIQIGILATVLAVIMLTACSQKPSPEPVAEIRIGVILYSNDEGNRVSTINAAEMATGEVNDAGGITIGGKAYHVTWINKVVRGGKPEESVAAAQAFINQEKVVAIVGPQYSSDAIPAGEVAERSSIPLISPMSTNPKTTMDRRYVFRMGFLDEPQGKVAATFLVRNLQTTRAAVIYNITDPYSRGIAEVFKEQFESLGGRIVAFEPYTSLEDDLEGRVLRVKESDPEIVYLPNFPVETPAIARLAREKGITVPFMGGDGWDRFELGPIPDFEGSYMTAHYSADIDTPKNTRFVAEYEKRFGIMPGDTAALTYDAFLMIFEAIRNQGKADPQSIRDGIYALGPYEGVGGSIDFVNSGDPEKGVVIIRFKDGGTRFVQIVNAD